MAAQGSRPFGESISFWRKIPPSLLGDQYFQFTPLIVYILGISQECYDNAWILTS